MIGRSPGPVHAVFGTRIAPETAMASPVADVEPYSTFQAATGAAISLAGSAYTVICCALITPPGAAAAAVSPAAYAGPVSAATQSRAIPTERRRRARRITAPRSFTMAGTAGRSAVLQHPVDPGEKVGDDLLAVGLVEHLVPRLGVRVDSDVGEPCRPVPVDQRVQQGESGVDRVGFPDRDVDVQVGAHPGDLVGVGEPAGGDEHRLGRRGVEAEAAPWVGDVPVDLRLVAAEPVEVGTGRLERRVEHRQIQRLVQVERRFEPVECGGAGERDGGDLVAVVEQVLLSGERAHAV